MQLYSIWKQNANSSCILYLSKIMESLYTVSTQNIYLSKSSSTASVQQIANERSLQSAASWHAASRLAHFVAEWRQKWAQVAFIVGALVFNTCTYSWMQHCQYCIDQSQTLPVPFDRGLGLCIRRKIWWLRDPWDPTDIRRLREEDCINRLSSLVWQSPSPFFFIFPTTINIAQRLCQDQFKLN